MSKNYVFLFLCISFLFAYPVFADEYHNQQVLVGEKAAGLGGTFVAIGDGAEACYYNPAGLTQLKISYLSVSSQILEYKEIKGKFLADPNEKLTSLSFVPSFWGIAKDSGEYKIGLSIVVPKFDDYKMHEQYSSVQMGDVFFDNSKRDQVNNNITYLIGPSIAKIINPKLSVGTTIYFHYDDILNREITYKDYNNSTTQVREEKNSENSGEGLGVRGIFGVMYKPISTVNFGLSFKTRSQIYNKIKTIKRNYVFGSVVGDNPGLFKNNYLEEEDEYTSIVPPSIILGVKWQANRNLIFASDISYRFSSSYDKEVYVYNFVENKYQESLESIHLKEIVNINFGSEYMLENNVPFRFGFFSDRSTAPKVEDNGKEQPMHIDNYGITVSTGVLSQNSTMIFGAKYGWGSGRMTNNDFSTGETVVDEVKTLNYAFNLSGSYNF